jgi:hypothetical protein
MTNRDLFSPNKIIETIISDFSETIINIAHKHQLPSGYLKTDLSLHLLQFSKTDLFDNGHGINKALLKQECEILAKGMKKKIETLPKDFVGLVQRHSIESTIVTKNNKLYEKNIKTEVLTKIAFKVVDPKIGFEIQTKLHYMGCERKDTLIHFGLFRNEEKFPFAYVAYSILDRQYLSKYLPVDVSMKNTLVLTRAYNINCSPKNAMTKLFSLSLKYIKENFPNNNFTTSITCVNPNLMFTGVIFKASNYYPFATVPFEPLYYKGKYITRKTCLQIFGTENRNVLLTKHRLRTNQIDCQPLVWFGRGLYPIITNKFQQNSDVIDISRQEYRSG